MGSADLANLPLLRAVHRIGLGRLARLVFAIATIAALLETILLFRPDLLRPTDLGSDTSNYLASAQRLLDGHAVYVLAPGDRPAPADYPPAWTVPILSPPSLPVLFAPLGLLPGPSGMVLWWAACFAAAAGFAAWMAMRAPPEVLLLGVPFAVLSAITAWSGNVNALLPGMAVLVWLWSEDSKQDRNKLIAVGAMLAIGTALKIGPVAFVPWLLGRGRFTAFVAFSVTAALIGAATIGLVGTAIPAYLVVSANSTQYPTLVSPVGFARFLGVPAVAANALPVVMILASAVVSVVWRREPRGTFAMAAAASVLASPVVRFETFAQLMMCFIPWAVSRDLPRPFNSPKSVVAACLALAAALAFVGSIAAGGIRQTTVAIANESKEIRVVRFQVTAQFATFGFSLGPGRQGVAWPTLWGTVIQPVLIFDGSCRLLGKASIPADGGQLILTDHGTSQALASSGRFLPFSATCAPRSPT